MRKVILISCLFLANFILLAHAVVPHHHHEETISVYDKHHDDHHEDEDCHDTHKHNHSHDQHTCFFDDVTIPNYGNKLINLTVCKADTQDYNGFYLISENSHIFYKAVSKILLVYLDDIPIVKETYCNLDLRAPPCI